MFLGLWFGTPPIFFKEVIESLPPAEGTLSNRPCGLYQEPALLLVFGDLCTGRLSCNIKGLVFATGSAHL